jgi:hypothetical protein
MRDFSAATAVTATEDLGRDHDRDHDHDHRLWTD